MITLLAYEPHHGADSHQVYLDVGVNDARSLGHTANSTIFNEAKAQKRKVGIVQRQFGGNTFFTYRPEQQSELELGLLASLSKPAAQVHISTATGEIETWNM
jgi:hypothetical protein